MSEATWSGHKAFVYKYKYDIFVQLIMTYIDY